MRLPPVPVGIPPNMEGYLRSLSRYVEMALQPPRNPPEAVLITSPDGSVWEVKVDNAGAVTTTKVSDG